MFYFKCGKCGQKLRVPERSANKKVRCPKCKSKLIVPKTKSQAEENLKQTSSGYTDEQLGKMSNTTIAEMLLGPEKPLSSMSSIDCREVEIKHARSLFSFFIPNYDEVSLFVMSVTFILLCLTSQVMRADLKKLIFADFRFVLLVLFFGAGMFFSVIHAFSTSEKNVVEKLTMLVFAVLVSAGTGIYAGIYMLKESAGWLLVFPFWNIINGIIFLAMFRVGVINVDCISDRDARLSQIIFGFIATVIIFAFCQYFFKLYWAITFSICVIYITSFDRAVRSVFGRE